VNLEKQNNTYFLRRRVPIRFKSVEPRRQVKLSLKTDSYIVAVEKAQMVWSELLEVWELRLDGDTAAASQRYEIARRIATRKGFKYMHVEDVAKLPLSDILDRVDAAKDKAGNVSRIDLEATMGTIAKPKLRLSDALESYWPMARDLVLDKSDTQVRLWKNPRKKAFANFIDVCGDMELEEITPEVADNFRNWWLDKIEEQGLTPNSANKDFTYIRAILNQVNRSKRLNLDLPFDAFKIKDGKKTTRPPFSRAWITDELLKPKALDGLNPEARAIFIGMINTGYRLSEGACLTGAQIHLDHNIPHISIEPVGRTLKNHHSERTIPLAGVSLEAFRAFPNGFPRYGADSTTLSATLNKFLTENGLRETPKHSAYCLRHSFEDRLLAQNVPDRLAADLMGHALVRERYGDGASLEQKSKAINAIAI
jgi:integrase